MKNIIVNKSNIMATIATLAIASNFYVQNANADITIKNGGSDFNIGADQTNTIDSITGLTANDVSYDAGGTYDTGTVGEAVKANAGNIGDMSNVSAITGTGLAGKLATVNTTANTNETNIGDMSNVSAITGTGLAGKLATVNTTANTNAAKIGTLQNGNYINNTDVATSLTGLDNQVNTNAGNISTINTTIGTLQNGNYINNTDVATSLTGLDNQVKTNTDAIQTINNQISGSVANISAINYRLTNVEKEVKDLKDRFQKSFASLTAMTALVPNARTAGDTQISIGTGSYEGNAGIAVGAFHYFSDNVLVNIGASYAGSKSTAFRAGITFGW